MALELPVQSIQSDRDATTNREVVTRFPITAPLPSFIGLTANGLYYLSLAGGSAIQHLFGLLEFKVLEQCLDLLCEKKPLKRY